MAVHANSTLVAVAWLQTLGLPAGKVGTSLPSPAVWDTTGFVVAGPTVGGGVNMYVPERHPVVQIDCYATFPGQSEKVNRGLANELAEVVYNATFAPVPAVTLRAGIAPVHLSSVYVITEPREIPEPVSNFGRFTLDLHIGWMEQTTVIG